MVFRALYEIWKHRRRTLIITTRTFAAAELTARIRDIHTQRMANQAISRFGPETRSAPVRLVLSAMKMYEPWDNLLINKRLTVNPYLLQLADLALSD